MLWEAMLRGTAVGLLTAASQSLGANVTSSKDTPVPAGESNWFVAYADAEMEGEGGGAPTFKTKGIVSIEVRSKESATLALAEALGDTLSELVKRTLLTAQGFPVALTVTNGSTHAVPADGSPALYFGFRVRGPGIPENADFVGIQTVNVDGSVELSAPYPGTTGEYLFNIGTFVQLFEQIDFVKRYPDIAGETRHHVFTDTIEFHGHVHEVFEPSITQSLAGIGLYIDSINIFDPSANYPVTQDPASGEPFTGIPGEPRTSGPDGRAEIAANIDLPQT